LVRGELDEIVSRAEAAAAFRERLIADLEGALAAEGYERDPVVLAALRMRFKSK
jgi:hypothetical protein